MHMEACVNAVEIVAVCASYGRREVLRGIDLRIPAGEWFCLLGPNGAGKSTLLHCLTGHVLPTQGMIRIAEAPTMTDGKRRLGYACAPDQLPGLLTGRQCLAVYAAAKQLARIDANIIALAETLRLTPYFDHYVDTYSLGTRQKLCMLLALLGEPLLIVLDEAFNGLDPRSALIIKRELQLRTAAGSAVLLATHSLDIVEHYAQRAALMLSGRVMREWSASDLAELRRSGGDFEAAVAAASEAES